MISLTIETNIYHLKTLFRFRKLPTVDQAEVWLLEGFPIVDPADGQVDYTL